MKKLVLTVSLSAVAFLLSPAQNLITKVPSTASVVIKYSGDNFGKNVSFKKLDSYSFIRDNFFKLLHVDTLASVQNTGIDFEQDGYQYVSMEDSSMTFVTLLHLKNSAQFLQLIKSSYGTDGKTVQKNGYQFLTLTKSNYVGWNANTAIIVYTSYQNKKNYYDTYPTSDSTMVTIDSVATVYNGNAIIDTAVVAPPAVKHTPRRSSPKTGKTGKGKSTTARSRTTTTKKHRVAKAPEEVTVAMIDPAQAAKDSIENLKRDLWDQQQDMIVKAKQAAVAEKVIDNSFTTTIYSIENDPGYKKIVDPAAHVSAWINAESLSKQYYNYFSTGLYAIMHDKSNYVKDTSTWFKSAINIYFDKDKIRMEQKTFSADPLVANIGKEVMNSKQNSSMLNYVNPDNIGYFSMSINTEAMENYNYKIMKKYLSTSPYTSEYADIMDVYIDLLEIVIDEKAIAELLPGNFLFVLHDMKPTMVSYTDYSYDSSYNRTEIQKTKKELSPNFTFVIATKKDAFMEKIAHLPVKYAAKEKFNYKDRGGYYELAFDSGKYVVSSLYFMVKDNKVIVTTSKEVIDNTLAGKGFAPDAATKKSILDNNYSMRINTKNLLQQLAPEFNTAVTKKIGDYFIENLGDIKMESSVNDNIIQTTTTIGIQGTHANSLEFLFNMADSLNSIIEKDKEENTKKID